MTQYFLSVHHREGDAMPSDDEMQQMKATQQDTTVPAASSAVLTNALAADQQIEAQVNLWWPPAPPEG